MRKRILTTVCAIIFGSFSSLWVSATQAASPFALHLLRDSTFHAENGLFSVPSRMTARSQILVQLSAQPTPTATQAIPAIADPTVILTLAGVIGAFVAVVVMLFALRGKRNK